MNIINPNIQTSLINNNLKNPVNTSNAPNFTINKTPQVKKTNHVSLSKNSPKPNIAIPTNEATNQSDTKNTNDLLMNHNQLKSLDYLSKPNPPKSKEESKSHTNKPCEKDSKDDDIIVKNEDPIPHINNSNNILLENNNPNPNSEDNSSSILNDEISNNNENLRNYIQSTNTNTPPLNGTTNTNYINNILEELKRQFFSIQYCSLLQKLFISYIFKNLEIFIEQITKNQLLGELVVNNIININNDKTNETKEIIQETENNNQPTSSKNVNLDEQVGFLKNINSIGINLTNALSNNVENLKNNGIKIFRSLEPSFHNNISSSITSILDNVIPLNTSQSEALRNINSALNIGHETNNYTEQLLNTINGIKNSNLNTLNTLNSTIGFNNTGGINSNNNININNNPNYNEHKKNDQYMNLDSNLHNFPFLNTNDLFSNNHNPNTITTNNNQIHNSNIQNRFIHPTRCLSISHN